MKLEKLADAAINLETEELAEYLLRFLGGLEYQNRHAFFVRLKTIQCPDDARLTLAEAWAWLLRECLIIPQPNNNSPDTCVVSPKGRRLISGGDFQDYRRASLLPKALLHPLVASKAWPSFIRADFDIAVFAAFKQVEVSVREAARFPDQVVGKALVRQAFKPDSGPLTNRNEPRAEQEAVGNLFDGAIGYCRNPASHRDVRITDPIEAAEMLILASHLLRIVDSRRTSSSP